MQASKILELYRTRGDLAYDGDGVTQLQHAWQCARIAERAGATPELQLACWLHDLGHLMSSRSGTPTLAGVEERHEEIGAAVLLPIFGAQVSEPVALHVAAKRYLVAARPEYSNVLSPDSRRSLALQGGPMAVEDCMRFVTMDHAAEAVRLRVWDDHAKNPLLHPVSADIAVTGLANLMDVVFERHG
jgi:predicted HD phosphohydrolase